MSNYGLKPVMSGVIETGLSIGHYLWQLHLMAAMLKAIYASEDKKTPDEVYG